MSVSLPDLLDPRKAVAQGAAFEGTIEVERLPRLCELLWRTEAGSAKAQFEPTTAAFRLEFGRDDDRRPVVTGRIQSLLPLRCQRCGQGFNLRVDAEVNLALAAGIDEANALPDGYDPLLVEDRLMRPSELIEDELILAIPAIPRHPDDECEPPTVASPTVRADESVAPNPERGPSQHPFASLAALRARRDDDKDQD